MKKLILSLFLFVTFFSVKSQDLLTLKPTGFVNDYESVFTPEQKDSLERTLSDYAKKTTIEISVATSTNEYDHIGATQIFKEWGLGNKDFNNGLLIYFSKENRKFSIVTGYGLEAFLPDGKLNQFTEDLKTSFRAEDYYGGVKELISKVKTELGDEGFMMLLKKQRLAEERSKASMKAFFSGLLNVILVLIALCGIGYLVYLRYKKRQEFLKLKSDISYLITQTENLKSKLGVLPVDVQNVYDKKVKLTNKLVTLETKTLMSNIYNILLDYKQTVNRIESSLINIEKFKLDAQTYLKDNYPYCSEYLKNELSMILLVANVDELKVGENDKKRMNKLVGIETTLENKFKSFLNKTVKIESIVVDKNNLNSKIQKLKDQNSEYIKKKSILAGSKIGKRYDSLVNVDFLGYTSKIQSSILDSVRFLEKGDFNSALETYGTFITTIAVLTSAFSSVDSLYNEYNKSVSFINSNKNRISGLVSDVDSKINKSGVSYSRKTNFQDIKTDITKYNNAVNTDVILAAALLGTVVNNLDDVYRRIKSDISSYSSSSSSSSYSSSSSSSSSYSSSDSGFSSFGGGDSGGGGVSGGW